MKFIYIGQSKLDMIQPAILSFPGIVSGPTPDLETLNPMLSTH